MYRPNIGDSCFRFSRALLGEGFEDLVELNHYLAVLVVAEVRWRILFIWVIDDAFDATMKLDLIHQLS